MTSAQSRIHLASQKQLMWWKFKQHRLALISGVFLVFTYLMIVSSSSWRPMACIPRTSISSIRRRSAFTYSMMAASSGRSSMAGACRLI
jgi:hypothetical protein